MLGVAAGLGSIEKKDQELLGTSEQRQCGAIRPACQATKSRLLEKNRAPHLQVGLPCSLVRSCAPLRCCGLPLLIALAAPKRQANGTSPVEVCVDCALLLPCGPLSGGVLVFQISEVYSR